LDALPAERGKRKAPDMAGVRQVVGGLLEEWETLPVAALRDLLAKAVREVRVERSPDGGVAVDVVPRWAEL
jgi:hypothetical protein